MQKFNPIEYFKTIAENHLEIAHDPPVNNAFFREFSSSNILFNNSDFLVKMRDAANTILVVQFNGQSNFNQGIDNNNRTSIGSIFLLERIKATDYDQLENARVKLLNIWEDIYSKIKKDISNGLMIRSPEVQINPIGMIGDYFYGISVFMSYDEIFCYSYNPAKWK